jgi:hypothetical protein
VSGIGDAGSGESRYCPECGQPLRLAHREPGQRLAFSWRSVFLAVVGLYFAITFGVGAWHAEQASRPANDCPGEGEASDCASIGRDLAQYYAARTLSGGAALAARMADRDLGSDLRFTAVGLVGVAIGVGALLLRLTRPHRRALALDLLFSFEGLVAVFYGQVLLIGLYLLIGDSPTGVALNIGRVGDGVFMALTRIFALFGIA